MIEIKIEKVDFQIPGSWDEVTVRQFDQMVVHAKDLNPVRVLSIFTGLDYDALNNFDCTGFIEKVLPSLSWLGKLDLNALPRKEKITLAGEQLDVIADPGKERIGQKLYMTKLVSGAEESIAQISSLMPGIIANYYAPYLHPERKWVENHVKQVEAQVWDMPIVDAAPEVNFFLRGYVRALKKNRKISTSRPLLSRLKRA